MDRFQMDITDYRDDPAFTDHLMNEHDQFYTEINILSSIIT